MSFKLQTTCLEVYHNNNPINASSGLIFNTTNKSYILSSKHSFCYNYGTCKDKQCSTCNAELDKNSIRVDSQSIEIIDIHQLTDHDIAIAKLGSNLQYKPITIDDNQSDETTYSAWKGGTEDRLLLNCPTDSGQDIRLNIKANINAHEETKNYEVSAFSGSPIYYEEQNKQYLYGILTDSMGINDVSCVAINEDILQQLENYAGENLFEKRKSKDVIDRSMENIDCHVISPTIQKNALELLIESSQNLAKEDPAYRNMIEDFQEFLTPRAGRNIIGLDNKLIEGGREDLLEDAAYLESRFARRVSKGQLSEKEQVVYYHCLSKINSYFKSYIIPQIKANESNVKIDSYIQEKIIDPLYKEIAIVQPMSMDMISGMLYFLTGKCHIRWKK
ncbi:ABC-three component system protein [Photobacterium alginatilyticum]|nr:ABC-three component system protein [Photobacterium alginatilyticum]